SERVAHGLEPRDLGVERFERAVGTPLRDLDLRGPAAAGRRDELARAVGPDGGHGDVDGHAVADGVGPPVVRGLVRRAQPRRGLGVVVVPERGELAPPGVAAQQHAVARVEAAEARGEPGAVDDGAGVGHASRLCHHRRQHAAPPPGRRAQELTSTTTTRATMTALNANATTACVVTMRRVAVSSTVTSAVENVVLTPAARYT